jgi:Flp pilus assembly protein TadG
MRYSKGQIAVILTLVMATLLGVMALSVDVGVFYYQWGLLQKAGDAGVLAGSGYLTGDPLTTNTATVTNAVTTFVTSNGVKASEIVAGSIIISNQSRDVQVTLKRTVPYFFARALGMTQGDISITAKAGINNTLSPMGVTPVGLECTADQAATANCAGKYTPYSAGGAPRSLFYKHGTTGQAPGNWDGLTLGDNGKKAFKDAVISPSNTAVNVGDTVSTEPGNAVVNDFTQGFNTRMSTSTWNAVPPSTISAADQQIILVPLVDFNVSGRKSMTVLGFAEMYVVNKGCPKGTDICAYFLKSLANAGLASNNSCVILGSNQATDDGHGNITINSCTPVLKQ